MDEKVAETLQTLANQLGTTVQYIYPHLVHYTQMQAISSVVANLLVLFLVTIPTMLFFGYFLKNGYSENYDDKVTQVISSVCIVFIYVIVLINVIANITNVIPVMIDPEGATILNIIKAVR